MESTSEESSPPTIGVTPGFESLLIIGTIAAIATYYRKRHMKS
ncbi:MAG: Heimdall-CTERM domain-containing surface protein [Candidatus Hodarchaeales archaeon]